MEPLVPETLNNYINEVPIEILSIVWQYLDLKDLYICGQVRSEWANFFKNKYTSKVIKENCLALWKKDLYSAGKNYLNKFENWRHMLKFRPFVRFDGFYVCKMMYRRTGMSLTSMNHPIHEVISYKYIRFYPDGTTISVYTNSTPMKFLSKVSSIFGDHSKFISTSEEEIDPEKEKVQQSLISGFYKIHNDRLTIR
mmetsp:Transcript_27020/g.26083  ORF Transcript_27020/g.26083 Transcript_27020/m.26083 type:complete len:196 (-) Transcript_27020:253-840(-)